MSTTRELLDKADKRLKRSRVNRVIDRNGEERTDCIVITPEMREVARKRKEKEQYRKRTDHPFTFVNMEGTKGLIAMDRLTTKELGYFLVLHTYIDYDNMLKKSLEGKMPMTQKEIGEALKIKNKKYYSNTIEKFIELGLMYTEKVTLFKKEYEAYFINKDYCLRGKSKDNKLVKVFINSLQELYGQEDIKPADIGFLFRVLPYIHYESNHLVRHPYEREYAYSEALSLKDVVEITGQDEKNVKVHLRMKLSGVHVFGVFKAGRNSVYKVNPHLFSRNPATEMLKSDFTLTGQGF